MSPFRLSWLVVFCATVLVLLQVQEADSIYAYAIKGIVKDVRLRPTKFIGGWFFKKAFILLKLKLKWKLKKKLILKKLLKKKLLLIGVTVAKVKGRGGGINVFAPVKIILPLPPRHERFAHGWGPINYWTHAPLSYFPGRRKRAVLFPEDSNSQQGREIRQFDQYHHSPQQQAFHGGSHSVNNDDYFQRYNIGSLGLSQTDLEQLRRLPDNLKYEYGHEMEQLEAAASEPKEEEIQDYLSVANEFDNGACIQKSICEIMSRGNRTANQFENQILEYYSDSNSLEKRTGTPTYVYDYAANLGKSSRDPRVCTQHFSSCSDAPQTLNEFMNEVFTPEMCDSSSLFDNSQSQYSHK